MFLFAIPLLLFSIDAHAFPLLEGASSFSVLMGLISTLLVGIFPKIAKKRLTTTTKIIFGILLLISVGMFFTNSKKDLEIKMAIEARSGIIENNQLEELNATFDYSELLKFDETYKIKKDIEWFFKLNEGINVINADSFKNNKISFYTEKNGSIKYTGINEKDIADIVKKSRNKTILFSQDKLKALYLAKKVYEATGIKINTISNFNLNPKDFKNNQELKNRIKEKLFQPTNIFEENLIDVRNDIDIRESRTLENAKLLSMLEMFLMTDNEIKSYLNKIENPVFTSYSEDDYYLVEERLKRIDGIKYRYLKGGLEQHFYNGNTTTPVYFNIGRILDPFYIAKRVAYEDNLFFICTEKEFCNNNLPQNSTLYLSFRELGFDKAKQVIQQLPPKFNYVVVADNQESYGNATLTGYWLNKSNKTFVGIFPISSRFSFDYIKNYMIDEDNVNIINLRNENTTINEFLYSTFKPFIDEANWIMIFVLLGFTYRLLISPAQLTIIKSYYEYKNNHHYKKLVFSSLFILITTVLMFYTLDGLIRDYGLVSHLSIDNSERVISKKALSSFLCLLIAFQTFISFKNKKTFYIVLSLLLITYSLGYIESISMPLLLFLFASEICSLLIQMPFYFKQIYLNKLAKNHIFLEPFDSSIVFPEKWLLVNQFAKTKGFLINNDGFNEKEVFKFIKKLNAPKVIVRSCSSNMEESALGGFYDSIICQNEHDILAAIHNLKNQGCDFSWIQPYYETSYNGIIQSFNSSYNGIELIVGKKGDATEGAKESERIIISRTENASQYKEIVEILKKSERFFQCGVHIEFGFLNGNYILYQIRLMNDNIINKLVKLDLKNYKLNESFLVKSSIMTGSILERITNKDTIFINNFLFENVKRRYRRIFSKSNELLTIESKLEEIEKKLSKENLFSSAYYSYLSLLLEIYSEIYDISQSRYYIREHILSCNITKYGAVDNNDMEVASQRIANVEDEAKEVNFRDFNHYLIVRTTYLLHTVISKYSIINGIDDIVWDLTIDELMSDSLSRRNPPIKDMTVPLTINNEIKEIEWIVKGSAEGTLWNAESNILPPNDGIKYILVGEEIGSGWVRNLDRFSGIVTKYGSSASHLALSAKELNIPYIKVNNYKEFIEGKEVLKF